MSQTALINKSELIHLLRDDRFDEFNRRVESGPAVLRNADLRLVDLRRADLRGADLTGAYLRNADLRGLDLADAELDGASIHGAQISGVRFPDNLAPDEIDLSFRLGTRMRTRTSRPQSKAAAAAR